MANREKLIEQYKKIAGLADKRLERIEKLSGRRGYENVTEYAYRGAMRDIEYWRGSGWTRFGRGKGAYENLTNRQIRAKIEDMRQFINKTTAAPSRITDMYIRRAETLNTMLGLKGSEALTWQQWADWFEGDAFAAIQRLIRGSDTQIDVVGQFLRQAKEIKKAAEINDYTHIKIGPDMVQDAVQEILREQGAEIGSFYGG